MYRYFSRTLGAAISLALIALSISVYVSYANRGAILNLIHTSTAEQSSSNLFSYRILVQNNGQKVGEDSAHNLSLVTHLSPELTFVSASILPGDVLIQPDGTTRIVWQGLAALDVEQRLLLSVDVQAADGVLSAEIQTTVTATESAEPGSRELNKSDTLTVDFSTNRSDGTMSAEPTRMAPTGQSYQASPLVADLTGSGAPVIVIGDRETNQLQVYNAARQLHWSADLGANILAAAISADITGNGTEEILVGDSSGKLHAYTWDGNIVPGWPVAVAEDRILASPTVGDLNGDNNPEIVVPLANGRLYALDNEGASLWSASIGDQRDVDIHQPTNSSAVIEDIDGDGSPEIVLGSYAMRLYVFNGDGTERWTFDVDSPLLGTPLVSDIYPARPGLEIAFGAGKISGNYRRSYLFTVDSNGRMISMLPAGWNTLRGTPLAHDLDGDGALDLLLGSDDGLLRAWHLDGTVVDGWPGATSAEISSQPLMADVDGDNEVEVVVSSQDAHVHAWETDGTIVEGWPQQAYDAIFGAPVAWNLDSDERDEIIASDMSGGLHVWQYDVAGDNSYAAEPIIADLNGDGTPVIIIGDQNTSQLAVYAADSELLWEANLGGNVLAAAATADLDGDGMLDILVGDDNGMLHAYNHNGQALVGWPVSIGNDRILAAPALSDLDGDGAPEIVVPLSNGMLHAFNTDGSPLWSASLGYQSDDLVYQPRNSAAVIVDIDDDGGSAEIVIGSHDGRVYVFNADGSQRWRYQTEAPIYGTPAVADIDAAVPGLEIAFGSKALVDGYKRSFLFVLDKDGYPRALTAAGWNSLRATPLIWDMDDDGEVELLLASDDGLLRAWHQNGNMVDGWPVATRAEISSSPIAADVDGDGEAEIVAASQDGFTYAWEMDGTPVDGWPKALDASIIGGTAAWNLDSDPPDEIVVGDLKGHLHILDFNGIFTHQTFLPIVTKSSE